MSKYILIYLLIINLLAFIFYYIDKKRAIKNKNRISEHTLLKISILGGSYGSLLGMYIMKHKTKKWYFIVINYFICIVITLLLIYFITRNLTD